MHYNHLPMLATGRLRLELRLQIGCPQWFLPILCSLESEHLDCTKRQLAQRHFLTWAVFLFALPRIPLALHLQQHTIVKTYDLIRVVRVTVLCVL